MARPLLAQSVIERTRAAVIIDFVNTGTMSTRRAEGGKRVAVVLLVITTL